MAKTRPENVFKSGFRRVLGFIWEGFGTVWGLIWPLLGDFWATLGAGLARLVKMVEE